MDYEKKIVTNTVEGKNGGEPRLASAIALEANRGQVLMNLVESYDGMTVSNFTDFIEGLSHVGKYQIKDKRMVAMMTWDRKTVSVLDPKQAIYCGEAIEQKVFEFLEDKIRTLKMVNVYTPPVHDAIKKNPPESRKQEIRRLWSVAKPDFELLFKEVNERKQLLSDDMEREVYRSGGIKLLEEYKRGNDEVLNGIYTKKLDEIYKDVHQKIQKLIEDLLINLKNIPSNLPWE